VVRASGPFYRLRWELSDIHIAHISVLGDAIGTEGIGYICHSVRGCGNGCGGGVAIKFNILQTRHNFGRKLWNAACLSVLKIIYGNLWIELLIWETNKSAIILSCGERGASQSRGGTDLCNGHKHKTRSKRTAGSSLYGHETARSRPFVWRCTVFQQNKYEKQEDDGQMHVGIAICFVRPRNAFPTHSSRPKENKG